MSEERDYSHVPGCHEPETDAEREVDAIVGRFDLKDWRALSEYWQGKTLEWLREVEEMSDQGLYRECRKRILDSASMNGYRGMNHVHFQSDACMAISRRRSVAAGHDRWCRGSIYNRAHNDMGIELFGDERKQDCSCKKDELPCAKWCLICKDLAATSEGDPCDDCPDCNPSQGAAFDSE